MPGYLETSDGKVHPGQVSLTRDAKLKIYDEERKRHREIPLKAIERIDCTVLKEWDEKEWRFKENASDEKYFTGRTYPAREYAHKITLQNRQTVQGSLSGIVYVQADQAEKPERFLLHKRDKGEPGTELKSLRLRPVDPARGEGARRGQAEGVRRDGDRVEAPEHREEVR